MTKPEDRPKVNSIEQRKKLQELSDTINNLSSDSNVLPQAKPQLDKIDRLITDINEKVIIPAEKGLTKEAVKKIQLNLGTRKEDADGVLGAGTKSQIESFLEASLKKIQQRITEIQPNSQNLTQDVSEQGQLELLNKEVSELKKEVATLENKFNSNNFLFSLTLFISLIVSLAAIIASFYKFFSHNRVSQRANNQSSLEPSLPRNPITPQEDYHPQDLYNQYNHLYSKISNLENKLQKLENSSQANPRSNRSQDYVPKQPNTPSYPVPIQKYPNTSREESVSNDPLVRDYNTDPSAGWQK
ncbi:MAG: hypothetical protein SAL70_37745 [Scytonema sp. PMC 1070.18]|nr:hypothetical protein [Scytonema sp. PMC 1070.18]